MKKLFTVLLAVLLAAGIAMAQGGIKKKRALPPDYGRVIISNYSEREELAPVVYDHWLHRAKFTCRLCHVDIGFAMSANATGIKAADNMKGYYCGACHNGKMVHGGKKVFGACSSKSNQEDAQRCSRCHALGKNVKMEYDFAAFTEKFPKERFGNGIDWVKTEAEGLIKLTDSLEGISMKRAPLENPRDLTIEPKAKGMPEIIFSHDRHSVWNGCEVCHPEIFPSVKKGGGTKFSMNEIFEGKYCGVCHGKVSFPMLDCQRCHSKPVVYR